MSTTTANILATSQGTIYSASLVYSAAVDGTGDRPTMEFEPTELWCGQYKNPVTGKFRIHQSYMSFDTSVLPVRHRVSATLNLYLATDLSTTEFAVEAWVQNYGTTGTWVSDVSESTLLTYINTVDLDGPGWYFLPVDDYYLSAVDGNFGILLMSSRNEYSQEPSGEERVSFSSSFGPNPPYLSVISRGAEPRGRLKKSPRGHLCKDHKMPRGSGFSTVTPEEVTVAVTKSVGGQVRSQSTSYATARSGGTMLASASTSTLPVGQEISTGYYYLYESFVRFDLSSIPLTASILSATLSLYCRGGSGTFPPQQDFTVNARLYDFGDTVTSADWVAGASLSGNTLVASLDTTPITGYGVRAMTSSGLAYQITPGGMLNLILCSSRLESGDAPDGDSEDMLTSSGVYPSLSVTYVMPDIHTQLQSGHLNRERAMIRSEAGHLDTIT